MVRVGHRRRTHLRLHTVPSRDAQLIDGDVSGDIRPAVPDKPKLNKDNTLHVVWNKIPGSKIRAEIQSTGTNQSIRVVSVALN